LLECANPFRPSPSGFVILSEVEQSLIAKNYQQ
jgi:hypothetical protein